MERFGTGYLEERKLVQRWPQPIPAIVALVLTLAIFYATWWIFQDPRGWMRMYTPYVGYMYTRWWLIMLIWMVYIFNYWPFKRSWLENTHPLVKGAVLTAMSVAILWVLIKGFFESLLGNFGIAYFNPGNLMKLPGMTEFFALEYASLACLMFAAIASWLSPAWVVACEEVPWQDMNQPGKGISILVVTFFLSTLVFFMTMHSHMGILYYPWQYFTSIAPPYWEKVRQHGFGQLPRVLDHVLHGDGLDRGNHLGALPLQADPHQLAAARGGLFRHHRHCLGHAFLPVFRAGADLGAGHPRHPPDQRTRLALAACRRDGGLLPGSGSVHNVLLRQLAAALQPAGQCAHSDRDHHRRRHAALYCSTTRPPTITWGPRRASCTSSSSR